NASLRRTAAQRRAQCQRDGPREATVRTRHGRACYPRCVSLLEACDAVRDVGPRVEAVRVHPRHVLAAGVSQCDVEPVGRAARGGTVFAGRAFVRFLGALARELGGLRLLGRLDHGPGQAHYPLDGAIEFIALPHYARLTQIGPVLCSVPGTVRRMWRALDDAD